MEFHCIRHTYIVTIKLPKDVVHTHMVVIFPSVQKWSDDKVFLFIKIMMAILFKVEPPNYNNECLSYCIGINFPGFHGVFLSKFI